jgi:uncharacterized protein YoxC
MVEHFGIISIDIPSIIMLVCNIAVIIIIVAILWKCYKSITRRLDSIDKNIKEINEKK